MTSAAYSSPGAAFVGAAVEYARLPAVAMAAAFVGFGAIVHDSGFDVVQAMVTTAGMTQIPAQIVLVETARAGAGLAGVFLAVAFIGARILPMVLSLMPLLTPGARGRLELYAATHLVATMSWSKVSTDSCSIGRGTVAGSPMMKPPCAGLCTRVYLSIIVSLY